MPLRQKVVIIFSRRDEKWAMLLRNAVSPLVRAGSVVLIDDSKLGGSQSRTDIAEMLAGASVASVFVSGDLLDSAWISKVKLPVLLEAAQRQGLQVCRIPVDHCFHELSGMAQFDSVHSENRPLDTFSTVNREAVIRDIAGRVRILSRDGEAGVSSMIWPGKEDLHQTVGLAHAGGVHAATLENVIDARKKTAHDFHRLAKRLFVFSLVLALLALLGVAFHMGMIVILIIAGAAFFIASMAFAVNAQISRMTDSVVFMKYVMTGLLDNSLPSRQKATLIKKADAILGK